MSRADWQQQQQQQQPPARFTIYLSFRLQTATVLRCAARINTQNSSSVCIVGMNYDMLNGSHARSHKLFLCAFLLTFWVW
jgi:hypothetical protein